MFLLSILTICFALKPNITLRYESSGCDSYLSDMLDPFNEKALSSGEFTASEINKLKEETLLQFYVEYGINFRNSNINPSNGYRYTINATLYSYFRVYELYDGKGKIYEVGFISVAENDFLLGGLSSGVKYLKGYFISLSFYNIGDGMEYVAESPVPYNKSSIMKDFFSENRYGLVQEKCGTRLRGVMGIYIQ